MQCPRCGMPHADWVKFCTECGTAITSEPTPIEAPAEPAAAMPTEPFVQPTAEETPQPTVETVPAQMSAATTTPPASEGDKPTSLGKWLGILVLEMLCSVAHLVLLFVWSFSRGTEKSLQNYARAKLIVIGASAVLAFLLVFVVFALIVPNIDEDISTQLRWFFFD